MKTTDHLQTIAYAYQEICQGEEPWVAIGNFMNAWFDYAKDRRVQLIAQPAIMPTPCTLPQRRWAVFLAASVEWLCSRDSAPCPPWVQAREYVLADPWWYAAGADRQTVRDRLIAQTPEPFTRRNIYCGNRMFNNKYELHLLTAKLNELRPSTPHSS